MTGVVFSSMLRGPDNLYGNGKAIQYSSTAFDKKILYPFCAISASEHSRKVMFDASSLCGHAERSAFGRLSQRRDA